MSESLRDIARRKKAEIEAQKSGTRRGTQPQKAAPEIECSARSTRSKTTGLRKSDGTRFSAGFSGESDLVPLFHPLEGGTLEQGASPSARSTVPSARNTGGTRLEKAYRRRVDLLDPAKPEGLLDLLSWKQFCTDARWLIDTHGSQLAAGGFLPDDIFGVHPTDWLRGGIVQGLNGSRGIEIFGSVCRITRRSAVSILSEASV